jgi:hypothetical protein
MRGSVFCALTALPLLALLAPASAALPVQEDAVVDGGDVRTAFAVLDADGDGRLTAEELRLGSAQLSLALDADEIGALLTLPSAEGKALPALSEAAFAKLLE